MAANHSVIDKGGKAEEALREYFRSMGSFALRGVPVREADEDVTDIDLWIYTRPSAHSRHIAILDIKNKRKGKAFERAIWVKGLQAAVRANEAIIASQGAKDAVHRFSGRLNVRVVSGSVFDAIVKRYSDAADRLSYETVDQDWKRVAVGSSTLKAHLDAARGALSRGISFVSLNHWLDEAASILTLAVERERAPGPIIRAAYLCAALVAIGADYLGREHSLSEPVVRLEYFQSGLRFGRPDSGVTKSYLDFAENIVTEFFDPTGAAAAQVRAGFENAAKNMPIEGLAEFFSRPNAGAELFKAALALEAACFANQVVKPSELQSTEAKTILGLISDYAGLKRIDVLGSAATLAKHQPDTPDEPKTGLLL
ncbi:hypothetical protein ABIF66_001570 [Bradyrhizobium japonicum]